MSEVRARAAEGVRRLASAGAPEVDIAASGFIAAEPILSAAGRHGVHAHKSASRQRDGSASGGRGASPGAVGFMRPGIVGRRGDRLWRRRAARPDRARPQRFLQRNPVVSLRRQSARGAEPLRRLCRAVADRRRAHRRVPRAALCAGGQGPRRSRGHGFDLLRSRQHSRRGGGHQVARLGAVDRHRRGGRPRGTDHPDRRRAR